MTVQNLSEQVVLVTLTDGHQAIKELNSLVELAAEKKDSDLIIDFSEVEMITTVTINNLLKLRNLVSACKHRLILSGLSIHNKCVFTLAGLDGVFDFAPDKDSAFSSLQKSR